MKFKKIILMFLVIVNTLIALPTMAEELPAIDITQLEDGSVKVSSDSEAAISEFVSLTIKNGISEVVILPKDITIDTDGFVFSDPRLDGSFAYVFVYSENVAITGNVLLTCVEAMKEVIEPSETSLNGEVPETPGIYAKGLSNKMLLQVWSDEEDVKFEILYSIKKNGKYKEVTQYDYITGSDYDPWDGTWTYFSNAYAYIKNPKVGKKYYIKARAYTDGAGGKTYSKWYKTTVNVKTGGIKNIVVELTAPNEIDIKWAKAKKAKKYVLFFIGYDTLAKAAYTAYLSGGGDPYDFDWFSYQIDIGSAYSKKRSFTFDITGVDKSIAMFADVEIWNLGYGYHYDYNVINDDEFCRPVQNVNVTASSNGEEVEFTFKSPVDITKFDMKRRDFPGLDISTEELNTVHSIRLNKMKETKARDGSPLDKMKTATDEHECVYDFNLFVSTKPNGTYKRVKTTADFSNPNNLKLSYKAKRGKKLYYKILPTVESIYWEAYYFPELHDPSNVSYYVNLAETPTIVEFKLPK